MMKKSNSQLALRAMRRASTQAIERAASKGLKIPVWKSGKVVLVNPKNKVESSHPHSANSR